MRQYYHICTEGLGNDLIFRTDKDYIRGMNAIGILAYRHGISILAFCLMDNHVHIVAAAANEACRLFVKSYKHILGKLSGIAEIPSSAILIKDREMLVNEIAYVLRNPMAAGIRATPFNYLWCSGPVYFNMMHAYPHKTIGEISSCNVSSRLHTKIKLPDHYRIRENGLIDPTCYVNHSKVETLFGNPGFMMACIARRKDLDRQLELGVLLKTRYTDKELETTVTKICLETFGSGTPKELDIHSRLKLAETLRKMLGLGIKQLARLTYCSPDLLARIYGK